MTEQLAEPTIDAVFEPVVGDFEKFLAEPKDELKPVLLEHIKKTKESITKHRETVKAQAEVAKAEAEKNKVPETYDLKLAEKSLVSPERVKVIADAAKAGKMTQATASMLLKQEEEGVTAFLTNEKAKYDKDVKENWPAALKADPKFGGANYDKNVTLGANLVARAEVEVPGFKAYMDETGAGSHPIVAKVLAWIAAEFDPKKLVLPTQSNQQPQADPNKPVVKGKDFFSGVGK